MDTKALLGAPITTATMTAMITTKRRSTSTTSLKLWEQKASMQLEVCQKASCRVHRILRLCLEMSQALHVLKEPKGTRSTRAATSGFSPATWIWRSWYSSTSQCSKYKLHSLMNLRDDAGAVAIHAKPASRSTQLWQRRRIARRAATFISLARLCVRIPINRGFRRRCLAHRNKISTGKPNTPRLT